MLKKLLPHLVAVVSFLAICIIYFLPQLEGKVINQGDITRYRGMSKELLDFRKETGERTLWTNAMFGGMPTYQIHTNTEGNFLSEVNRLLHLGFKKPIGLFFLAMCSFYILMLALGINPWLGAIGAVSFGLTTNNLVLYEAGHVTKVYAVAYLPIIAAGVLMVYRKQYLAGGILFAAGLGLDIYSNHVQMTYYFGLTLIIYGIARLIYDIKKDNLPHFAKATGILVAAAAIAVASSAVNLWTTYEYAKDTMRGEPILKKEATVDAKAVKSSSETNGLAWDYAMGWSNGTLDLFSAFIPGVVGGGSSEKVGDDAAIRKSFRSKGVRLPRDFRAPLYWGALPFTSGPIYFGAVIFFLFIFGALVVKGPAKWWLVLGTLLTFFLSMGKNFEAFNLFFFNNVPLYSKFRSPNSILSVTAMLVPLLGIMGVSHLIKGQLDKKEALQKLYVALGIMGGMCLFFAFMSGSFFDFAGANDARYAQSGYDVDAIIKDRKSLLRGDALRSLLLILCTGGLIWAYLQEKLKLQLVLVGLGLLSLFDIWGVGKRYLDSDKFIERRDYEAGMQARPVDTQIMNQEPHRGAYRVLDYSQGNPFQSVQASFYHSSVGGYHAAKLQRIQDMIDYHFQNNNTEVMNMFNIKYVIGGQVGQEQVQQNPAALGTAWFVDSLRLVQDANAEINALGQSFNAATQAIIHQEFGSYVADFDPSPNGKIRLEDYQPNHLTYTSTSNSEQLAIFSEVWYGPDKGWQAYIDGKPMEHIRANYILRAMRIPSGTHTIEFKFEPKTYYLGVNITRVASLLIILALFGFFGFKGYERFKAIESEEDVLATATPAVEKTKSKRRKR
ncbi:MAG: YfhO family protein [Bacteroidota bacterium]